MKIIIFGDSITQGYHDLEGGGWANRLHIHAMRRAVESDWAEDHSVFVLGISGDTISKLDERFDIEFSRRRRAEDGETLTIFAYGINDSMSDSSGECRTQPSEFRKSYVNFIQSAKDAGPVVLIGLAPIDQPVLDPIPWHTSHSYLETNRTLFDGIVCELADEYGCTYIPMSDVWGDDVVAHTTDGIHPNAMGHSRMFGRIRDSLISGKLL